MERGKESGEAYHPRLGKMGKRLEKRGEQALEANLWKLDFIQQAIEKHLRLFDRFAIQDGSSGHSMEGKLERDKIGNQQ